MCKDTIWDTPNVDILYAKLEEADWIYDFLVGLNPKIDLVHGRILGHKPLSSIMEVCYGVCLEEYLASAMSVLTTFATNSAALSA